MHDILRETPIYQEILKEGREEGLEALRQAVVDIVAQRFPQRGNLHLQVVLFHYRVRPDFGPMEVVQGE